MLENSPHLPPDVSPCFGSDELERTFDAIAGCRNSASYVRYTVCPPPPAPSSSTEIGFLRFLKPESPKLRPAFSLNQAQRQRKSNRSPWMLKDVGTASGLHRGNWVLSDMSATSLWDFGETHVHTVATHAKVQGPAGTKPRLYYTGPSERNPSGGCGFVQSVTGSRVSGTGKGFCRQFARPSRP